MLQSSPGSLYIAPLRRPRSAAATHRLGDLGGADGGDTWPASWGEKRQSRRQQGRRNARDHNIAGRKILTTAAPYANTGASGLALDAAHNAATPRARARWLWL